MKAKCGLATKRRRSRCATAILAARYGSPRHGNKDDPLDELVFIVLSQMTTHHAFNRVFARVKARLPNWEGALGLGVNRFRLLIAEAGLSYVKAPRLLRLFETLRSDFGKVTLEPLRLMTDDAAEHYLTGLPGVGVKTARCVMMYSLARQVLPVDTHVWRVAKRLGLLEEDIPYPRVHAALDEVVASADRYAFHVNAISFGRELCLPRGPRCEACPLLRLCPFGRLRLESAARVRLPTSRAARPRRSARARRSR
ncbi:MAG: hypothetical protein KIT84_10985 [Labilithrix sp.]|nr:hypothetical protein [Labilithrix sp.]MCW5811532.1 hypothetical protein [Labilithrix sp.]